jgi:hypothetical protein
MNDINEANLYQEALHDAKEHLSRWEELGTRLNKTLDFNWKIVQRHRQAGVKQLEALIQSAAT